MLRQKTYRRHARWSGSPQVQIYLKFRVRINWDAPSIITYAEGVCILKMNFNPTGVTGDASSMELSRISAAK